MSVEPVSLEEMRILHGPEPFKRPTNQMITRLISIAIEHWKTHCYEHEFNTAPPPAYGGEETDIIPLKKNWDVDQFEEYLEWLSNFLYKQIPNRFHQQYSISFSYSKRPVVRGWNSFNYKIRWCRRRLCNNPFADLLRDAALVTFVIDDDEWIDNVDVDEDGRDIWGSSSE